MSGVFISYAREDSIPARRLHEDLRAAGVDSWIDSESLLPGENWREAIIKAIRRSRYFIALLSNYSVSKIGFFQREVKLALEILEEQPPSNIYLIPIRLNPCELADNRLLGLQWLDMFPSYDQGFRKLLRAIEVIDNPLTESPVPPLIAASTESMGDIIAIAARMDTPLIRWVGTISGQLALQNRGALLTIGDHESVLRWSTPSQGELSWNIIDLSQANAPSLGTIHYDGATVLSSDGRALKEYRIVRTPIMVKKFSQSGLHTRHYAAIGMSIVTRALCVAVSSDGIVSAFLAGQYLFRASIEKEVTANIKWTDAASSTSRAS